MSRYIQVLVASQVNITVQPRNAEAHECPASIALECQQLANEWRKPVVLIDRDNKRVEFLPRLVKQTREVVQIKKTCPVCSQGLREGDTLTAKYIDYKDWWCLEHTRDGKQFCALAGFQLAERI